MLGIFDSGLGGLTVLRHVRRQLPREDIVYLADQAHVPYGDRSQSELRRLLGDNVAMLLAERVDAIVMGCNTSCAIAATHGWPAAHVPILDLIAVAAADVVALGARRVGVVATAATAGSGAYGNELRRLAPGIDVQEVAAPQLVPLVEAGLVRGARARAAVAESLRPLHGPLDAVVLACTHFPLLAEHFVALLPAGTRIVDPALAQARSATAFVRARGGSGGSGTTRYLTNGDLAAYRRALAAIVGELRPGDEVARAHIAVKPGR